MKIIKNKTKYFLTAITLFRVWMASCLPLWALAYETDDMLMVRLAYSLQQGQWLGEYNQYTLQKGMTFPAFLAIINELNIHYNLAIIGMWILASAVFCYALKEILSKRACVVLYVFLLFNPIMVETEVVQRLYRSALTPSLVLLLMGFYLIMYFSCLKRGKNRYLIALCAGITLAFYANMRDDAIFMYPFIAVVSVIMIVLMFIKKQAVWKTVCMLALPFLILTGTNNLISAMNYWYYGVYLTTEPSNSAFKDFRDLLYSIEDDGETQMVSVPRSKLKRLYEYSPTLKSLEPYLEQSMDQWTKIDRNPDDKEVEDGFIRWALRTAVNNAGYYQNAVMANELYAKIAKELTEAVEEGKLTTRKLLPVDVLPVWKNEYLPQLGTTLMQAFKMVITYENINAAAAEGTGTNIRFSESMSGELAIYPHENTIKLKGWIALKQEESLLKLRNKSTGKEYVVTWQDSPDVEAALSPRGQGYKNLSRCRFLGSWKAEDGYTIDDYILICQDSEGNELMQIALLEDQGVRKENAEWYLDEANLEKTRDIYQGIAERNVARINIINSCWKFILNVTAVFGGVAFVVLAWMIFGLRCKTLKMVNSWLIALASLLTFTVLAIAESLLQITAFDALGATYLSPGYVLMMIFFLLPVLTLTDYVRENKLPFKKKV